MPGVWPGFLNPDDEVVVLVVGVVAVMVAVVGVVAVLVAVVVEVVGVVLAGTVGVVVVEGWQLATTLVAPGGTPGICAGTVLAAAFTVIVTGAPPDGGVYVTVQTFAYAIGIAATPHTPRTKPTVRTVIFSLWLIDTLVNLLPPRPGPHRVNRAAQQGR